MLFGSDFIQKLPYLLAALIPALTFHEWGHALMANRFGDHTPKMSGRLTLNPLAHLDPLGTLAIILTGFIGWAKPVPINASNFKSSWGEFWVSLAGPMMNIALAIVAAILLRLGVFMWFGEGNVHVLLKFLQIFLFMNLGLAFFNLIPLGPLDGSHVLARLLPLRAGIAFREFNFRYGGMLLFGIILMDGLLGAGILSPIIRTAVGFTAQLLL